MMLLNDCPTSQVMPMVHDHTSRAGKMDMNTTVPVIDRPSDFSGKTQENKCVAYSISMDFRSQRKNADKYVDCNIAYS